MSFKRGQNIGKSLRIGVNRIIENPSLKDLENLNDGYYLLNRDKNYLCDFLIIKKENNVFRYGNYWKPNFKDALVSFNDASESAYNISIGHTITSTFLKSGYILSITFLSDFGKKIKKDQN